MILREMPATWDARFRTRFYARWGRENCIISARTRRAEYPLFEQRLSVKMAAGGSEDYFVDERSVAVAQLPSEEDDRHRGRARSGDCHSRHRAVASSQRMHATAATPGRAMLAAAARDAAGAGRP